MGFSRESLWDYEENLYKRMRERASGGKQMITLKEVVIVVASATAVVAVGYVALIGTIILTA